MMMFWLFCLDVDLDIGLIVALLSLLFGIKRDYLTVLLLCGMIFLFIINVWSFMLLLLFVVYICDVGNIVDGLFTLLFSMITLLLTANDDWLNWFIIDYLLGLKLFYCWGWGRNVDTLCVIIVDCLYVGGDCTLWVLRGDYDNNGDCTLCVIGDCTLTTLTGDKVFFNDCTSMICFDE